MKLVLNSVEQEATDTLSVADSLVMISTTLTEKEAVVPEAGDHQVQEDPIVETSNMQVSEEADVKNISNDVTEEKKTSFILLEPSKPSFRFPNALVSMTPSAIPKVGIDTFQENQYCKKQ